MQAEFECAGNKYVSDKQPADFSVVCLSPDGVATFISFCLRKVVLFCTVMIVSFGSIASEQMSEWFLIYDFTKTEKHAVWVPGTQPAPRAIWRLWVPDWNDALRL